MFDKEYSKKWFGESFTVINRELNLIISMYELKDYNNDVKEGFFRFLSHCILNLIVNPLILCLQIFSRTDFFSSNNLTLVSESKFYSNTDISFSSCFSCK